MTRRASMFAALLTLAILAPSSGSIADGVEKTQPGGSAASNAVALPADVLDVAWQWIWFGSGAEQFEVDHPELYTLQFSADGSIAVLADCNHGRADYTLAADRQITLTPVATTRMLCPEGSLDNRFLTALEHIRTYFQKDGDFLLEAPADSGTLRFRRAATD